MFFFIFFCGSFLSYLFFSFFNFFLIFHFFIPFSFSLFGSIPSEYGILCFDFTNTSILATHRLFGFLYHFVFRLNHTIRGASVENLLPFWHSGHRFTPRTLHISLRKTRTRGKWSTNRDLMSHPTLNRFGPGGGTRVVTNLHLTVCTLFYQFHTYDFGSCVITGASNFYPKRGDGNLFDSRSTF